MIHEKPVPTNVYHSSPRQLLQTTSSKANNPLMIFVPGNPGVVGYYTRYFELLSEQFPTFEILAISHAGHDIPLDSTHKDPSPVFSLKDQIDHKIAVIEDFLAQNHHTNNRDVIIIGHSVGTWMMERIIMKLSDKVNFKFIGFLTPTVIDIHKSEKGQVLYPLVKVFPFFNILVSKFSQMLTWYPLSSLKTFALNKVLNNPPAHAFSATHSFISNSEHIRQSLGLATEEMHAIQGDWEFFRNFLDATRSIPLWVYFSNVDHWVNNETQAQIKETLSELRPDVKVESSDDIVHSFCVKQSEEFAQITTTAINELYYNKK